MESRVGPSGVREGKQLSWGQFPAQTSSHPGGSVQGFWRKKNCIVGKKSCKLVTLNCSTFLSLGVFIPRLSNPWDSFPWFSSSSSWNYPVSDRLLGCCLFVPISCFAGVGASLQGQIRLSLLKPYGWIFDLGTHLVEVCQTFWKADENLRGFLRRNYQLVLGWPKISFAFPYDVSSRA